MKRLSILFMMFVLVSVSSSIVLGASYDFGGQVVKIQHNVTYERQFDNNPEQLDRLKWLEDTFNVKIEWSSGGRDETMVAPLAAAVMAGDAPDLIRSQSRAMSLAASEGLLMPLDPELVKEGLPESICRLIDSCAVFGGKFYAFAPDWPRAGQGIWWNKSLFEREGLPNLYELFENGEWTWDVFRDIALKATRDTNGDGQIDQWGFTEAGSPYHSLAFRMLASNEADIFRFDEQGNPIFVLDEPAGIAAYTFLQDPLLRSTFLDGSNSVRRNAFWRENTVAMFLHNPDGVRQFNGQEVSEDDYGFIPQPRGPHATRYVAPFTHADAWSIPITSKYDPAALIELIYAFERYTDEYADQTFEERLQDTLYQWSLHYRDFETVEYVQWVIDNVEIYSQADQTYSPWFTELNVAIIESGDSPAAAIAAIRNRAQTHLEQVFSK